MISLLLCESQANTLPSAKKDQMHLELQVNETKDWSIRWHQLGSTVVYNSKQCCVLAPSDNTTPMFCSFRRSRIFLKELPVGRAPDNRPLRHNRSRSGANVVSRRQNKSDKVLLTHCCFYSCFSGVAKWKCSNFLRTYKKVVSVLQAKSSNLKLYRLHLVPIKFLVLLEKMV